MLRLLHALRKGPTAQQRGLPVYTSLAEHPGDGHDPAEDGDQSELVGTIYVPIELIQAHRRETS